jgi:carboxymethylenebutenolidase
MRVASCDGGSFEAYVATPPGGIGPGIVVLTPIFGLEPGMREVVDSYAARGYVVMAPDLFSRTTPGPLPRSDEGKAAALDRKARIDVTQCMDDLAASIEALRSHLACNGKVGVVGFCFGGRYAYLAAAKLPIDVAAAFHPTEIGVSLDAARFVRVPLSLHFGGHDAIVPLSEVDAISRALRGNTDVEIYTYPQADHSFAVPGTRSYDASVTELAQARMFSLFDRLRTTQA